MLMGKGNFASYPFYLQAMSTGDEIINPNIQDLPSKHEIGSALTFVSGCRF
jgi:hypothetical protein